MFTSPDALELHRLYGPPAPGFDCGEEEQNTFFYEHAWPDQQQGISVTYVYEVHGMVAGYATLFTSGLLLGRRERLSIRYEELGALKLGQMAVHRAFAGRGLGHRIVADAMVLARRIAESVGCPYLILDARDEVVGWYESIGFIHNVQMQEIREQRAVQRNRDPARLARSRRLDIRRNLN